MTISGSSHLAAPASSTIKWFWPIPLHQAFSVMAEFVLGEPNSLRSPSCCGCGSSEPAWQNSILYNLIMEILPLLWFFFKPFGVGDRTKELRTKTWTTSRSIFFPLRDNTIFWVISASENPQNLAQHIDFLYINLLDHRWEENVLQFDVIFKLCSYFIYKYSCKMPAWGPALWLNR